MPKQSNPPLLKGEGERRIQERVRATCENCGEPATFKQGFLLPNYRSNPASSAYRRDDCSYCSDMDLFTCDDCKDETIRAGEDQGHIVASRFPCNDTFAHMFLVWETLLEARGE